MTITIESKDPNIIKAIKAVAEALKVHFSVHSSEEPLNDSEIQRRLEGVRAFKGGLKKYQNGYESSKYDWYEQ